MRGNAELGGHFKRRKPPPNAVVDVVITAPRQQQLCQPEGARTPQRCG